MICPKCGRPVDPSAVICSGCDFILDTEFLGDEILDEEQSLRPGIGGVDPAVFNLADAVILGDIDEQAQSFETSDSGFHVKESTGARLYVSGRSQAMMAPDAVPAVVEQNAANVRLTPFEKHVLSFIDGKRPVEIIRLRAGLDESEVKTALATLADKGVVQVVGRALVDTDPFQETAQRRALKPRRASAMAGAMAAAIGPLGDETDRAIEEAFRTSTGLSPLNVGELSPPPDDDGNVFSSLSGDPLADVLGRRSVAARDALASHDEDDGAPELERGELPSDTAFTQRPDDDDLPSDADSFDVMAHTSEIERRPAADRDAPRLQANAGLDDSAPSGLSAPTATRGRVEPMATNARRVLSDPELAEILGDDDSELPQETRAGERPSGLDDDSGRSEASDGFDDFGQPSELDTALLPGVDSSLSQGPPDSEVFKSATGTVSTPLVAQPNPAAMANLQARHVAPGSDDEESATAQRPQLVDPDRAAARRGTLSEAAGLESSLGDGGDLADLVGGDPPSLEGTDTSKVGSAVNQPAADVHSVVTAAPALHVPAADSDESVDPFADLDLEESDEQEEQEELAEAASGADDEHASGGDDGVSSDDEEALALSREDRHVVPVPSEDLASSDEGTAAFAQNPFAVDDDDGGDGGPDEGDEDDAVTSTRPVGAEPPEEPLSSVASAIYEVADDDAAPSADDADDDDDDDADDDADDAEDFYEGATDGVPALSAADDPSSGALLDAFSDEEPPAEAPADEPSAGAEDPRNRPPRLPAGGDAEASVPVRQAPQGSFASEEELIDDAMIIRPAAATMQVRGASVLERAAPRASPVSVDASSAHEEAEVEVSEPAQPVSPPSLPSASVPLAAAPSQETAHLERPQELAALSLAAPRSRSEETALFSGAGAAAAAASSELSQGGTWASRGDADVDDRSAAEAPADESSDATHVLVAPPARPPSVPEEASEAPPADVEEARQPIHTGSRNEPEAMREKARKLFEDALKDYREGRIGAARMNAKLATIYDPANEEYRAALEQWGKGARRKQPPTSQQASSYAVLYDEAQEREGAGDIEGAIGLLLQGADQFPEIAAIQNRLGVLLAIHKREYDRAAAYIQRAIELDSENLHYKSNLGKILSRRRQRQKRANG